MHDAIILYSDVKTKDTILELWAASTKHPDSVFHFSKYRQSKDYVEFFSDAVQIYQWLLQCASHLTMPFYAKQLADYAAEYYDTVIHWG